MDFTIRNGTIDDAEIIFEMTKKFHEESNLRNEPYTNTFDKFKRECFAKDSKVYFLLAEFQEQILGYSTYLYTYSVISGPSIQMPETYIKEDYRDLGISTFLYARVFDIAYENKSNVISWAISLLSENKIRIKERLGVIIDKDTIVLNTDKKYLRAYSTKLLDEGTYDFRLVKTYELPDVFAEIKALAKEAKRNLRIDIYKLMDAVFSNPKLNILVAVLDNEIKGFISFYENYYTYTGKKLIVDQVYVVKEKREERLGLSLLLSMFSFAYEKDYKKVESFISKYEVKRIEGLKEYGVFPYDNLRMASYKREEFEKLYDN